MTVGGWTLTYIRVKDKWVYLYRAVDSSGATIDFLLSAKRDAAAAERFQSQSLGAVRNIRRRGSLTPTSTPVIHPPFRAPSRNDRETGRIADRHGKRGFAVPECAGGAQKTGRAGASD
jgi:hypothetical protein